MGTIFTLLGTLVSAGVGLYGAERSRADAKRAGAKSEASYNEETAYNRALTNRELAYRKTQDAKTNALNERNQALAENRFALDKGQAAEGLLQQKLVNLQNFLNQNTGLANNFLARWKQIGA